MAPVSNSLVTCVPVPPTSSNSLSFLSLPTTYKAWLSGVATTQLYEQPYRHNEKGFAGSAVVFLMVQSTFMCRFQTATEVCMHLQHGRGFQGLDFEVQGYERVLQYV